MSSPICNPMVNLSFGIDFKSTLAVISADELILMILEALYNPVEPKSYMVSDNEKNYHNCMLVNRQWCKWAQRMLWKELSLPERAFDAVLQQFDVAKKDIIDGKLEDQLSRRPREAYIRYGFYAAMVESMRNYRVTEVNDLELQKTLHLFDLKRHPFPRLKRVELTVFSTDFWLPLSCRHHSITEIYVNITGTQGPVGIVRDISRYCTRLERLTIDGLLHESDIDLLQVHRFVYLTSLSLKVDSNQVDNFMRIVLFISHNLTDLVLFFRNSDKITIARRGSSFRSLRTLRLDGLSSIPACLEALPSAPNLQTLLLTSCSCDIIPSTNPWPVYKALKEYGKRSPFTKLEIDSTFISNEMFDVFIFSDMDHLTDLSLTAPASGILPVEPAYPTVWHQLKTLTVIFVKTSLPQVTLYDFFLLATRTPYLTKATIQMDVRMDSNPGLLSPKTPKDTGDEPMCEGEDDLCPGILEYQTTSLRNLDFSNSPLVDFDALFLFSVLEKLAPNLELTGRMLDTLCWKSRMASDAKAYLNNSTTHSPATMSGLISTLSVF
ncbi:hypothetical protein M408DRAFT_26034 [Serendipita vermifera MAFF 305830]|uniref:F-box domain-containing protein n=1 Tax=Serendipita vermifera MAFF 305830 TaxID=933852 RepID=A0A0C3B0I1_SERVB|nr:hypothetical protein M408DRAFT_26034 [Serendipita vermifera MAFF 305830]